MEMDMVNLLRSSSCLCPRSKAVSAALLFIIIYWAVPLLVVQQAHAEEMEGVLPESGIRYPGGFDLNTVGKVEGKVQGYFQPKSGPVRFQVASGRESYTVLVSPAWYWKDLGAKVSDGTQVRVRGSKSLGSLSGKGQGEKRRAHIGVLAHLNAEWAEQKAAQAV